MKKINVLCFCNQFGAASDEIPVIVRNRSFQLGKYRSLFKLPVTAMPGVLEAKITFVTMTRDLITIQVAD